VELLDHLPEVAVRTGVPVADWREAVIAAGEALVDSGATAPAYTDEMIAAIDAHGPYVVIAPGLALAHSRPSPAVHRAGLSWVGLAEPVAFGHDVNDPVDLVLGLAALDHDGHLEMMSELAGVLADEELLTRLRAARSAEEVRGLLGASSVDDGSEAVGKATS